MTDPAPAPDRPRDSAAGIAFFLLALGVSLVLTHVGWKNRLADTHPFRQTQTALSTYWMLRDGFRLDYETPTMGAPWSIPMEFPLYQAVVCGVVRTTGVPLESAGRGVSLFFFYAGLPAIWLLLARFRFPSGQRWLFLALVLTCPIYLFYSRTFLIESTAWCLGWWWLYAFHVSLFTRHRGDILVAALLGVVAGITKVTSYAVFLAPAFLLGVAALVRQRGQWRTLLVRGAVAALPGVAAATAWIFYADLVKRRNVMGVMMTSTEQRDWNYGPWSLRVDPSFWEQFGQHLRNAIAPGAALVLIALVAFLFLRRSWLVLAGLLVAAMAGPLVFANLYFVHDYYLYSSGVFFLAALALPLQQLLANPQVNWPSRWGAAGLVLAVQVSGYFTAYYPRQAAPATEAPEIARALRRSLRPDDVILGFGMNWSSILPYYAERKALMVPDRFSRDDAAITRAIANLGTSRIGAVVLFRLGQPPPEFFAPWLKKLGMDENPFMQTGEFTVHLRKDMEPDALKALADFKFKDVLLYQGQLMPPGQKPPLIYWADQVADKQIFSMMSPLPRKVTVPFGIGAEMIEGRYVFTAHSTSEVEIPTPPNARHVSATFGLNPAVYDKSDGIEVEVIYTSGGARQELYRRYIRPGLLRGDQGPQDINLDTLAPMNGAVLFRILPGGGPNYDWAYWAKIEVR